METRTYSEMSTVELLRIRRSLNQQYDACNRRIAEAMRERSSIGSHLDAVGETLKHREA